MMNFINTNFVIMFWITIVYVAAGIIAFPIVGALYGKSMYFNWIKMGIQVYKAVYAKMPWMKWVTIGSLVLFMGEFAYAFYLVVLSH
jgi:hypothetical protein